MQSRLTLILVVAGMCCLVAAAIAFNYRPSPKGPLPLTMAVQEPFEVEALQSWFPQLKDEPPPLAVNVFLLSRKGCLLALNDVADYASVLESWQEAPGQVVSVLIIADYSQEEADKLVRSAEMAIPVAGVAKQDIPARWLRFHEEQIRHQLLLVDWRRQEVVQRSLLMTSLTPHSIKGRVGARLGALLVKSETERSSSP